MIAKSRNFGLDVIRAISISLVLFAHSCDTNYEFGLFGVQIFFVLSGFLIGQILIKDFNKEGNLAIVLKFWKRRWFRTLPMYYLVLIGKIIFFGNPYGWKMVVYFFFLQANFIGVKFFGVSWSLVVEEWFYVFLPLLMLVFFRKGLKPKSYLLFIGLTIFIVFLCRFLWNYFHKGVILYQFDCLMLGVLLAYIKLQFSTIYKVLSSFWIFVIGLIGAICFLILFGDIYKINLFDTFYKVTWYLLVSFFIALLIPFVETSTFINKKLKHIKPLYYIFTWTSILTYSIYLLHMDVFHLNFGEVSGVLFQIVKIVVLYIFCFITYFFFEHPMLSLRDNFTFKHYVNSIKSMSFKLND